MSLAVCEISGVCLFDSTDPFRFMKFSRFGICYRSDGTFGLSLARCTLSTVRSMTCWTFPDGELSWQLAVWCAGTVCADASDPTRPSAPVVTATTTAAAGKTDNRTDLMDSPSSEIADCKGIAARAGQQVS